MLYPFNIYKLHDSEYKNDSKFSSVLADTKIVMKFLYTQGVIAIIFCSLY